MRWALVIFVLFFVLLTWMPQLRRFGVGRLPGGSHFGAFGRKVGLPLMSTMLLAVVGLLLIKLF